MGQFQSQTKGLSHATVPYPVVVMLGIRLVVSDKYNNNLIRPGFESNDLPKAEVDAQLIRSPGGGEYHITVPRSAVYRCHSTMFKLPSSTRIHQIGACSDITSDIAGT